MGSAFQSAPNALLKKQAYRAFRNAMAWKLIPVPPGCERCGRGVQLVAHHPDYRQGTRVVWLCRVCHAKEHRGMH